MTKESAMGVLAVIQHHDEPELLLTVWSPKRRTFGLPGGKVEPGETLVGALLREVEEEVGVSIQSLVSEPFITRGGDTNRVIAVFQAARWSGKPRMGEVGCPYAWMPLDHLIDENAHPYAAFYTRVFAKLVLGT